MISNIRWDIENRCNLSCKHCLVGHIEYPKSVDFEKGLRIIDKLKAMGTKEICFSTKEPFMNDNIIKYIKYCSINNIYASIITNGTKLNEEVIYKLLDLKIKYLAISMEGWTKETNDYIRGEGNFELVKKKLDLVYEINSKNDFPLDIVIQTNITEKNYNKIDEFVDFFSKYNQLKITIGEIIPLGNASDNPEIILKDNNYIHFINKLFFKLKNLPFRNELNFTNLSYYQTIVLNALSIINNEPRFYSCPINNGAFSVLPNGDIVRCSYLLDKKDRIKEFAVLENRNILEQSNDVIFKKIENFTNFKYKKNSFCIDCKNFHTCNLCYAQQMENGSQAVINCQIGKIMYTSLLDKIINKQVTISTPNDLVLYRSGKNIYIVNKQYKGMIKQYTLNKNQYEYLKKVLNKKSYFYNKEITKFELKDIIEKNLILIEGVSLNDLLPKNSRK